MTCLTLVLAAYHCSKDCIHGIFQTTDGVAVINIDQRLCRAKQSATRFISTDSFRNVHLTNAVAQNLTLPEAEGNGVSSYFPSFFQTGDM